MPLHALADITGNDEEKAVIVDIGQMSIEELLHLAESGTLSDTFQAYYETVVGLLEKVNHHTLEILNKVEQYALEETGQIEPTDDD